MRVCILIVLFLFVKGTAHAQMDSSAVATLSGNSVEAAVYNNGFLFWNGTSSTYRVPKDGPAHAIFSAAYWMGGIIGDDLRVAGSEYGPALFRPGTIDEAAGLDRIYNVSREDVINFERGEPPTADMLDWPWQHGAPVLDGDGRDDNYDLAAGDRPAVTGDQILWWIMTDIGAPGGWFPAAMPIGLEISVTAAAISKETFRHVNGTSFILDAIDHTTFYTYRVRYVGDLPLEDAYVAFFVDTDLGNAADDYLGSDSLLGLAYSYNGDDEDGTSVGYGDSPPAIGFDFMRGFEAPQGDGIDNDRDGVFDEAGERLSMQAFIEISKGSGPGVPSSPEAVYAFMQALWADGSPITVGGNGTNGTEPTTFMYSGDPPDYWSMDDLDGAGARTTPTDKRFLMSMGPVHMEPGDVREFTLGIVWAQADTRIASVHKLKSADEAVQKLVDGGLLEPDRGWFDIPLPEPPNQPSSMVGFGLMNAYPNPFGSETNIPYRVAETVHVRMAVYDLLGRELAVLVDGERPAGVHEAYLDATDLAPGVYFVRMEAVGATVTTPILRNRQR